MTRQLGRQKPVGLAGPRERLPHPTDGRGRVVLYAGRGTYAAEITATHFAGYEARWNALIARDRLRDGLRGAISFPLRTREGHCQPTAENGLPSGTTRPKVLVDLRFMNLSEAMEHASVGDVGQESRLRNTGFTR
jgi:hypothetical protein